MLLGHYYFSEIMVYKNSPKDKRLFNLNTLAIKRLAQVFGA